MLYPNEEQVRLTIRGWRTCGLSWLDAHLWSFAEFHHIPTLYSEDFQQRREAYDQRVTD